MAQKELTFAYAIRSFMGHLEGTQKAAHTIHSYQSDLSGFQKFLETELASDSVSLTQVTQSDLDRYYEFLKSNGFKTNTRRRKLLTVRRFLRYLTQRNRIHIDISDQVLAPYKVERVPVTITLDRWLGSVRKLSHGTPIEARNRVLLWVLSETGCLVSEIPKIRYEDWNVSGSFGGPSVTIHGKNTREVPVSVALLEAVTKIRNTGLEGVARSGFMFFGFNKFGPLRTPITPRGVELLVKSYGIQLGYPEITPRVLRHSVVLHWFKLKLSPEEIQRRLGLKTMYAFRVFEPILEKGKDLP